MAPDRRFGLPHPLDTDPSEDSSPRKPGLWESLKRAIGSAPPKESTPEPAARLAQLTPRPPPASADVAEKGSADLHPPQSIPVPAAPAAPTTSETAVGSPAGEMLSDVPFLEDLPLELTPAPPAASADLPEPPRPAPREPVSATNLPEPVLPPAPPDPPGPTAETPRLARGLASFSRDNAEREKKFAHLLRDQPEGEGKNSPPPRRRR